MAETKLDERLISGTGMLRMPATEAAMRYVSVLVDVIRQPRNSDRSFRYSPYRQRFATAVFLRKDYVIAEAAIDYSRRRFDYVIDQGGQNLIALKCALKAIKGSSSPITNFANLNLLWDEVRFVCYLDTAIQVRLYMDTYDDCGDAYNEKAPPPPPPPLPPVPPGTSIGDISRPYPDNDNVTSPNPIDTYPPLPPTNPDCQEVTVTGSITFIYGNQTGQTIPFSFTGLAPWRLRTNEKSYLSVDFSYCAGGQVTGAPYRDDRFVASISDPTTKWFNINTITPTPPLIVP